MFTAIVVAMVLIFAATALGLLDYNAIWVNPTYLWPGIVGGLIMGAGFIIGGSARAPPWWRQHRQIDGVFFVLGGLTGIFLFGETVEKFSRFWESSYLGRLTVQDWLKLPAGVVVVIVVLMALFMFWGGEQLERIFGQRDLKREQAALRRGRRPGNRGLRRDAHRPADQRRPLDAWPRKGEAAPGPGRPDPSRGLQPACTTQAQARPA